MVTTILDIIIIIIMHSSDGNDILVIIIIIIIMHSSDGNDNTSHNARTTKTGNEMKKGACEVVVPQLLGDCILAALHLAARQLCSCGPMWLWPGRSSPGRSAAFRH